MKKLILTLIFGAAITSLSYAQEKVIPDNTRVVTNQQRTTPIPIRKMFTYRFNNDVQGWKGGFADYPQGEEGFYELDFEYSRLPSPLDKTLGALKQTGNNHSDDLFMFIKRKITGLVPNKVYQATFDIQIATNVADGMVGVGGSPGESVYIKAGLTKNEPMTQIDTNNYHRMNIDKGNQAQSGQDMIVLGNFANGTADNIYTLKDLSNSTPFRVQANENGELWFVVGTDSGFEAVTAIYYNYISVNLQPNAVISSVTGAWYDPAYSGMGFSIIDAPSGYAMYFFGYKGNNNGETLWLISDVGPVTISKGQSFDLNMYSGYAGNGGDFVTKPSKDQNGLRLWGSADITFHSCNEGTITLNGDDGTLTHNIIRLIDTKGLACNE